MDWEGRYRVEVEVGRGREGLGREGLGMEGLGMEVEVGTIRMSDRIVREMMGL